MHDQAESAHTLGDTYLFGANIVNAFRLTANRIAAGKLQCKIVLVTEHRPSESVGVNAACEVIV
jgi:hypothetical protein